jgi:hypothetical protein
MKRKSLIKDSDMPSILTGKRVETDGTLHLTGNDQVQVTGTSGIYMMSTTSFAQDIIFENEESAAQFRTHIAAQPFDPALTSMIDNKDPSGFLIKNGPDTVDVTHFGGTGGISIETTGNTTLIGLDGTLSVQNIDMGETGYIRQIAIPTEPDHVANKNYVDKFTNILDVKESVDFTTVGEMDPSQYVYHPENGTIISSFNEHISYNTNIDWDDSKNPYIGMRILVKDQISDSSRNGIFEVGSTGTGTGAGATHWEIHRSVDADTAIELHRGAYTFVTHGNTNKLTGWIQNDNITDLVDDQKWNQFSGMTSNLISGSGLYEDGLSINVGVGSGMGITDDGIYVNTGLGITSSYEGGVEFVADSAFAGRGMTVDGGLFNIDISTGLNFMNDNSLNVKGSTGIIIDEFGVGIDPSFISGQSYISGDGLNISHFNQFNVDLSVNSGLNFTSSGALQIDRNIGGTGITFNETTGKIDVLFVPEDFFNIDNINYNNTLSINCGDTSYPSYTIACGEIGWDKHKTLLVRGKTTDNVDRFIHMSGIQSSIVNSCIYDFSNMNWTNAIVKAQIQGFRYDDIGYNENLCIDFVFSIGRINGRPLELLSNGSGDNIISQKGASEWDISWQLDNSSGRNCLVCKVKGDTGVNINWNGVVKILQINNIDG